jgi:hypothetical protein
MKKLILFLLVFISLQNSAQEIKCVVQVVSSKIEGTDKRVFDDLRTSIYEFINNRKWTGYNYKIEERIECNILINVDERVSVDQFKGTIQVQATRPVFNTSYNSTLLNFMDRDFEFDYVEQQSMDFDESTFTSNLTSVLAYYVYFILGLDGDSYALNGGDKYYQKAEAIVNSAQNRKEPGWKAYENQKNRYWLIENMQNSAYSPMREAMYLYHRKGMDVMTENMDIGRQEITKSIEKLRKVYQERPGLFGLKLFMDVKREEIINIYSKASAVDKQRVVNILKEIDPANASKYQTILVNK